MTARFPARLCRGLMLGLLLAAVLFALRLIGFFYGLDSFNSLPLLAGAR